MGRIPAVFGLFVALIEAVAEPKISVVTALLPPRGPGRVNGGAGARLRVEASGGCFRWVSQRPDLVVVEEPLHEELPPRSEKAAEAACQEACLHAGRQFLPEETQADDGCQAVAIIRSVAESIENVEKVLILAQDIQQPAVELRCEVYITNIDRIEVETSVRRINVDDVETLGVKAYDKQGNVFSSLEGLQFRWRLGNASILQSPKLVESAFKLSPVRRLLAEAGAQPDTVLLRGVATGRTTVGANLTIGKQVVISPEVHLTVLENIVVMPSLLYAPPMAHLQLQLKVLRGPRRPLEEFPPLQLPVPHFRWHAQAIEGGEGVVFVESELGRVVTQRLGSGRVLAVDSRIENNTAATVIYVTNPVTLRFWTQPLSRASGISIMKQIPGWGGSLESGWEDEELHLLRTVTIGVSSDEPVLQLVQGRTYALKLELLDKNSQLMQIPLNLRARAYCQASNATEAPLQLLHQASNSAVLIFRALELGEGHITIENLTLEADKDDKARNLKTKFLKLVAKQAFYVSPQLEPIVPVGGPMLLPRWHSYLLKVRGNGRQVYALRSQPPGAITVSPEGRVQAGGQLASGELTVQDVRNSQNNFTMRVLVRRAGRLILQPRYLQIQMPREKVTEKDEEPVVVRARPEDGSEDADVCEAMCRMLRNLTFWNCTALFSSDRISAEVSNRSVASVSRSIASGEFAACNIIRARPLAPGRFQLTARAQEADASEPLPSKPLPFEVYKPLEWQLVDIKDSDEVIAAAQVDQTAALVLAPCSSIRLRLAEGPVGINVPGRESWNVTAGPHITVSRVGPRGFKVTCIQVTPGPVRLQGQVSHVPSDVGPHGEIFVDNLTLWMRCSVPARVQAVAELDDFEHDVVDKEPRLALGVQRGQATDFRARFVDAFGRTIVNASEYMLRWSLSPSSKEGVAFQKAWLNINKKEISAFINVPADATVGATAKLGLEVSLPPSSLCHSMAALAALPLPTRDELPVVVAKKLELRWPGHPEKARFAMFKNLSVVVEAGYGTGRSRLEILSGHNIIEVLEASEICSEQQSVVPCVPALWIGSPCNTSKADDVQRWFLLPTGQGTASLAFWDPDLLGARPQPLEITIRAAKQLDLRLGEDTSHMDGRTVLVVRGTDRPLGVDVRDADGQALGMVNWVPLGLKVHSSDPGALQVKNSASCGEYECLCHTPGTYRLFAEMQDYPNGTIHSRVLHVECLPEFDVVLKDIVVMPGQAFELAFTGGPARNERTYFEYVSSDPEVASIDNEVGLVLALKPGDANLSVLLLERPSGREIARKGARIQVRVPTAASIGAVEALTGASSKEEMSFALLRSLDDPLRLRARIWSGDLELTPLLLAMAASKAGPLISNQKSQNLLMTALDMGEAIVESTEAASQTALQLALSSGFVGSDAATAAAAHGVSCRFLWTTNDPLNDVASAIVVELYANSSSPEQLEVALVAECPLGRGYETLQLEAKTVLPVLPMLKLMLPTGPCPAYPRILVPLHGRVPLSFSMPRSQLKVEILGGSAVQLLETGEMVEVEAGSEGEASLKVEALASPHIPPMQISVSSRKVFAARMENVPARLPLSASALCPLFLVDATGQTLSIASNFQVEASSSLTSIVTAEAEAFAGGAALHLRAVGEGCTLLSFVVRLPDSRQLPSDVAEICVVQGALVGHGPILVQPGARLNLDAEIVSGGFSRSQLAFSLRLLKMPANCRTLEETALMLSKDLSSVLAEGLAKVGGMTQWPLQVRRTAARWAIQQAEEISTPTVEVDLQVSASDLAKAAGKSGELGLFDLAEVLWQENLSSSETLQWLDRSWGLHGVAEAKSLKDRRCQGCCVSAARCRSCCNQALRLCGESVSIEGWSSSHPKLMTVEAGHGPSPLAIAQAPGMVTLHYCDGVMSADIQVTIARGGELLAISQPEGGPTEMLRARKLVSNEVSSPLSVDFRAFREGGAQVEDELQSGPFIAQNLRLECEPVEANMKEYFDFEAVGEACILKPKLPSIAILQRSTPLQIGLAARLQGSSSRGLTVEWQFVPQFVVMKAKEVILPSQVCATLTTSTPNVEVPVWTGGHHIEAELDGQLFRSRRRGNLTLEVRSSHLPVTLLRISWNDAVTWGNPEEVNLRLSSPATGQVEVYRLRVEPNSKVSCDPEAGSWSVLEILMLLVAVLALLWLLIRFCTKTAVPNDHLGEAFQGVGAGPILRGDPFAGHAASPFHAFG